MGAEARLRQIHAGDIPAATHRGKLPIGDDVVLDCFVLDGGLRVIAEKTVAKQLGRGLGGKSARLARRDGLPPLPDYFAPVLEPYVPDLLRVALTEPIVFRDRGGPRRAINATLLTDICQVWVDAWEAGALQVSQIPIAERAAMLIDAFKRVGAIALVDSATGYEDDREAHELERILAAYINDGLLPWAKRFPNAFYDEMFRLKGWERSNPASVKRPKLVGKLTSELVYERLPQGVIGELRAKNPVVSRGGSRAHKHHQFLTEEIGHPHLSNQVAAVTALMRAAPTWSAFMKMFDRAFPDPRREGVQTELWPGYETED